MEPLDGNIGYVNRDLKHDNENENETFKHENENGSKRPQNEFTQEQRDKINQLRERLISQLRPEQLEDNYLVKWLIARRFNVDKAEEMLRKHLRFIKANNLDALLTNSYTPPEIFDYFYTAMLGYDKGGSVVRILNVGACDIRGLCMSLTKDECLKYASYVLLNDHLKQKADLEQDKINDMQVYILDLQGLSWRTIIQRIVVERAYILLRSYEANHPERLKVAYIINAPGFFSFIYKWLNTVLPDSIISKLEILSEDELQEKLTRTIDPSILPANIGGTRTDPNGDATCQSLYRKPLGSLVPEEFMPTDQLEALQNDPNVKRVTVDYKSIFIAEKVVTEPNSSLIWDFQTVDYDIRMGLRYKPDEQSEPEEIIPAHRVASHILPESGKFICDNPGIYELVFDNTYSWMTSKELLFKINLLPPPNDID